MGVPCFVPQAADNWYIQSYFKTSQEGHLAQLVKFNLFPLGDQLLGLKGLGGKIPHPHLCILIIEHQATCPRDSLVSRYMIIYFQFSTFAPLPLRLKYCNVFLIEGVHVISLAGYFCIIIFAYLYFAILRGNKYCT